MSSSNNNHEMSSSQLILDTVKGSHEFTIKGYSLAKGIGVGRYMPSRKFTVGGHDWVIEFYPDGYDQASKEYVSLFLKLVNRGDFYFNDEENLDGEGTDEQLTAEGGFVRAKYEFQLLNQSGERIYWLCDCRDTSPKIFDTTWGYPQYIKRSDLETRVIKDDCLIVYCTVEVVQARDEEGNPVPTMQNHFKELTLEEDGAHQFTEASPGDHYEEHTLEEDGADHFIEDSPIEQPASNILVSPTVAEKELTLEEDGAAQFIEASPREQPSSNILVSPTMSEKELTLEEDGAAQFTEASPWEQPASNFLVSPTVAEKELTLEEDGAAQFIEASPREQPSSNILVSPTMSEKQLNLEEDGAAQFTEASPWEQPASNFLISPPMAKNLILRGTLVGHSDIVTAIACPTDNSNMIVTSSRDKSILVWTLDKHEGNCGVLIRRLTGHDDFVQDVVLSSDAKFALSGSLDGELRLWDLNTGDTTRRFVGHTRGVLSVAFYENDSRIVSASRDCSIKLWNTLGECLYTIQDGESHTNWVSCVRFCPQASEPTILSASWDKTVKFWNLTDCTSGNTSAGDGGYVNTVAVSALQDNTVNIARVSTSWDKTVEVWNLINCTLRNTLSGHGGYVNTIAVSPDGTLCASAGKDGFVLLWDIAGGKQIYSIDAGGGIIHALCFNPNRYWICAATEEIGVQIWDLETKCVVHNLEPEPESGKNKTSYCSSLNWNSDGSTLFTGYTDGTIGVWELHHRSSCPEVIW